MLILPPQNILIFLFIFQSFGLCHSFIELNTYEWTIPKRKWSFQTKQFLVLLLYTVGWGKTGLTYCPPSKMFWCIYLSFSLSVYVTLSLYSNNYEWPIPKREFSFQPTSLLELLDFGVGKRMGLPYVSPPKCSNLSFYISVLLIILIFYCILTIMNDIFQRNNQVFNPTSLLVLLPYGVEEY